MYICVFQEPSFLFICTGFVPPQELVGMNPEVPSCAGETLDVAFIYANHPVISTIPQVPLHSLPPPPPTYLEGLGTAALSGTYHKRFGVIIFLYNSK